MLYQVIENGEITESYAMPDHDDSHHLYTLPIMSETLFRANPATGTTIAPERINDGSLSTNTEFDNINEYIEITFDYPVFISKYRTYGYPVAAGNGEFKIEYNDGSTWAQIAALFPTYPSSSWSAWANLYSPVFAYGIKVTATAIDTLQSLNIIRELQVVG